MICACVAIGGPSVGLVMVRAGRGYHHPARPLMCCKRDACVSFEHARLRLCARSSQWSSVVAVVQIVADDLVNRAGMEGAALLARDPLAGRDPVSRSITARPGTSLALAVD